MDELAPNVWICDGATIPFYAPPFPIPFPYQLRMVVIRLMDGSLFVHSPVQLSDAIRAKVDEHGIENHDPNIMSATQRTAARLNRMLAPHGETPLNFRLSFLKRRAARRSLRTIMDWKAERVLLMHGPCVTKGAQAFLENGFAWLAP